MKNKLITVNPLNTKLDAGSIVENIFGKICKTNQNKLFLITFLGILFLLPIGSASFNITIQDDSFPVLIDEDIPSELLVSDLDNDGFAEIIVETFNKLDLYDSSATKELTFSPLGSLMHTVTHQPNPVAGNVAGDGNLEVVFGDRTTEQLYVFNSDGTAVPGFYKFLSNSIYCTPTLEDVDNDGYSEIAIGDEGGSVYLVNGNGTDLPGWPVNVGGAVRSAPALGDIDGDGELEVVITSLDNKVYAFNIDGSSVTGWPQSISDFGVVFKFNNPAVGDLDDDGIDEVVVAASVENNLYQGKVIAYSGDGSVLWTGRTKYNAYSSPVIGNIDKDSFGEVVVGSVYNVWAFEHDGTSKWVNSIGKDEVKCTPKLVDVNDDDINEVFLSRKGGGIYGWYGDGTLLMEESVVGQLHGAPSVIDIDGDGILEIVIGTLDRSFSINGYIHIWKIQFNPVYPEVSIVSPAESSSFATTQNITFEGNASDADEGIIETKWSSDIDGDIGTGDLLNIDAASLTKGNHTISYTAIDRDSLSSSYEITIHVTTADPKVSINTPLDGADMLNGTLLFFNATAYDLDGTVMSVNWHSSIDGNISNVNPYSTSNLSVGSHTITFTAVDNDGLSSSTQVNVNIREPAPPSANIVVPVTGISIVLGETVLLSGESNDTDGKIVGVEWDSSLDGYLGSNSSLSATLSEGLHNISFSVIDDDDLSGADYVTIEVKKGAIDVSDGDENRKSEGNHNVNTYKVSDMNQKPTEEAVVIAENESDTNQISNEAFDGFNENGLRDQNLRKLNNPAKTTSLVTAVLDGVDAGKMHSLLDKYTEVFLSWILKKIGYI